MPTHADLPNTFPPERARGLRAALRAWRERRQLMAMLNADDEPVESYRAQASNPELLEAEQEVNGES